MKKLLKIALCVFTVAAMLCTWLPVSATDTLDLEVETTEDYRNKDITLTVDVKNNPGVAYLALTLNYSKEYMTLTEVKNGTVIKDFDQGTNLIWTADGNSTATGTLASLTFKISLEAPVLGDSLQKVDLIVRECYDENFNDVAVNVTSGGIYPLCGHENTVPIPEIPATCNQAGYTAGIGCYDCPYVVEGCDYIPPTGIHQDADGSWEADGTGHHHTCACGTVFDSNGHSGGMATCAEPAICSVCGYAYSETDKTNHGETELRDAKDATCDADGYTGDSYCTRCGELVKAGTVILGGHEISKIAAVEPTHEQLGNLEHYACSRCGKLFADENGIQELEQDEVLMPKGEHSYSDEWSSNDETHWYGCECGSKLNEETHSYSGWIVVQEPTETADGSKMRTCSVCAYMQTEILPASNNPPTADAAALGLYAALMIVALCGIAAIFCLYPRQKNTV